MRENKYRLWDGLNHKMLGYGNGDYREWCVRSDGKIGYISKNGYLTVHSKHSKLTVLMFTGLHDKNGKEIYEGDIVKGVNTNTIGEITKPFEFGATEIVWDDKNAKFQIMGWFNVHLDNFILEVIGNIYETPELLTPREEGK